MLFILVIEKENSVEPNIHSTPLVWGKVQRVRYIQVKAYLGEGRVLRPLRETESKGRQNDTLNTLYSVVKKI
jgi:hypothetical protein